jgi:hypothetical protein
MDYDNFDDIGFSNNIEQNDLDQLVQKQKDNSFFEDYFHIYYKNKKKKIDQQNKRRMEDLYMKDGIKNESSPLFNILFAIYCTFTFYFLLIAVILTGKTLLKIYIGIFYFISFLSHSLILNISIFYKSKKDFEQRMEEILNADIKVYKFSKSKKIFYPREYIIDLTGEINIPKKINFAEICEIDFYIDKDFNDFITKEKKLNKKSYDNDYTINLMNNKTKKEIKNYAGMYKLNDSSGVIMKIFNILVFFLLFSWIKAFYIKYSSYSKFVRIYPIKLLTDKRLWGCDSKFTFHGKSISIKGTSSMNVDRKNYDEFEEKYDEFEKRKEEEKKIKKEKQENTTLLSDFKNNNFEIKVKKIYDNVKLYLFIFHYGEIDSKRIFELGEYNGDIEENIEDEGSSTVYTPKGFDIEIVVNYYEDKFNIKIGNIYSDSYYYYNN